MAKRNGIGASEKTWTIYYNRKNEPMFAITSTEIRDKYFLYQNDGGSWKKIDKASSPVDFEQKHSIRDMINTNK